MPFVEYEKNKWEDYDLTKPTRIQPDAIITTEKLQHMEDGIARGNAKLVPGNLVVGTDANPAMGFRYEGEEIEVDITFPRSTQINDPTISSTSTWSSAKIREEIDMIANNNFYSLSMNVVNGLIFVTSTDVKKIEMNLYKGREDITLHTANSGFKWTRSSSDEQADTLWNADNHTGRELILTVNDIKNVTSVTYTCTYTGIGDNGENINVDSSSTFVNMIIESSNTSITFELYTPNGTVFGNDDSMLVIEANAYQGGDDITSRSMFRWYQNNSLLSAYRGYRLEIPVENLPLENILMCEMVFEGLVYKKSVNITNRKNVMVSDTPTNDPYLGDIWLDTNINLYKKWTDKGWVIIEDPTKEISGEVLIAIESIKTVQENGTALVELREQIRQTNETLETNYNQLTQDYDTFEQTLVSQTESIDGISRELASIRETAGQISLLVTKNGETSKLELTPEFIELMSKNVKIEGVNVDITGFTTINGAFRVDDEGYMHATKGGTIGPWTITDDALVLNRPDQGYRMSMGINGIDINNMIKLTPVGGFDSPNFKIDPIDGSVTLNADSLKLGGTPVATTSSKIGVRNLIRTSGAYQYSKSTYWECDELPWTLKVEPIIDDTIENDTTETYITFEKVGTENEADRYIRLPLSEELTYGSYVFNIRAFSFADTYPKFRVYLLTEDNRAKQIADISALPNEPVDFTFNYNHTNNMPYKYIGIKCSEYEVGYQFSIVNMSLYKSEIIVREWQPAPEDSTKDYSNLMNNLDAVSHDISMNISTLKGEIATSIASSIFNGEEWVQEKESILTQSDRGITIETIVDALDSAKDYTDNVSGDTAEKVDKLYEYIKLIDGDIVLGNNKSATKLSISNDMIGFSDGDTNTGFISGHKLYNEELEALSLKIGKFKIINRANGRLTMFKDE